LKEETGLQAKDYRPLDKQHRLAARDGDGDCRDNLANLVHALRIAPAAGLVVDRTALAVAARRFHRHFHGDPDRRANPCADALP
ncbi:hypothetical protein, partial [Mesorhizobium sp.]|uniref:hypothetical protein n=1 Tax=Mesorhizobium sp. TaxID=1871066 RepID=UPI0025D9BF96